MTVVSVCTGLKEIHFQELSQSVIFLRHKKYLIFSTYLGVSVHQTVGVVVGFLVVEVVGLETHHGALIVGFCVVEVHQGVLGNFSVVEEVAHQGIVGFFVVLCVVLVHQPRVVVGLIVGFVVDSGTHHGDVVVFFVVVVVHLSSC